MYRRFAAELGLILATVIWGGTFVATRIGLEDASPYSIIAIRFLVSGALAGAALLAARVRWWRRWRQWLVLGLVLSVAYLSQTVGLQYTSAARSAFITYLFAVFVPPLQLLLTSRRLVPANLVGLAVVIAGALIMTQPWQAAGWNPGDLITLASAVAFALFVVLLDRFGQDRRQLELIPGQFLVTGVVAVVAAVAAGSPLRPMTGPGFWAISYLTLLGTVGGLGLQTWFQPRTTPVRASTIYALEPVCAGLFGYLILAESLAFNEFAGGAVILAGVLYSELGPARCPARGNGNANEHRHHPRDHQQ